MEEVCCSVPLTCAIHLSTVNSKNYDIHFWVALTSQKPKKRIQKCRNIPAILVCQTMSLQQRLSDVRMIVSKLLWTQISTADPSFLRVTIVHINLCK